MNTTKPYLIRAIHEWATDNDFTPQILVSATVEGVKVPQNHVKDGHIVFNIHHHAVKDLSMGNEWVFFSARFSGQAMNIEIPVEAVMAIYARENGQGIFFQEGEQTPPSGDDEPTVEEKTKSEQVAPKSDAKPSLKLVK